MPSEIKLSIDELIQKVLSYQPDAPTDLLRQIYAFADLAHRGQKRVSGEEYISHPLGVASILAELQIDVITISAAILHDVVEDTSNTLEGIEKLFGREIAMLVDGVTKLSRIEYKSKEEQQLENYRKMFLAMAKDIRVVLIKLADRLHNMRTLKYMPELKQKRIAQETMEIYAPLAHRLGISNVKWELEDLSFRYLEPEKYYELVEKVKQKRKERQEIIDDAITVLSERLQSVGIQAEIQGRPKHFYSIYKKMLKDHKDLSEIYDLSAVRVVVDSVKDCYGALGIVHTLWKPIPMRFKDFIAMPKSNMYQSLHTTVIGTRGQPLEIQIRTWEMHRTSEYGIAAHWRYKEGPRGDKDFDQKLSWLRQLLDWQQDLRDPREFMETLKMDVFSDEVFVFTPKGDVLDLPAGSIPLDFAYRVHTDVGHRCIGARVNGKIVPLEYKLNNGDIVEILTSKQSSPSRDWLNIAGSSETRNKIRQWFKKEKREENIIKGREMMERESKKLGYDLKELTKGERLNECAKKLNISSEDDLLASLGYGGVTAHGVMIKLIEAYKKEVKSTTPPDLSKMLAELKPKRPTKSKVSHGVLVKGESGVLVKMARCCSPLPGDAIVGYITRGRGVSVHRADCTNIVHDPEGYDRIIEVSWDIATDDVYHVMIEISAIDRPGILTEIMMVAAEIKLNVSAVNAKAMRNKMSAITLCLDIGNLNQLEQVMAKMRRIKDVYSVHRAASNTGGAACEL